MILAAMALVWSVTTCPANGPVRSFRFERATLPLTITRPEPALVWLPFDSYDAALCVTRPPRPNGCLRTDCQRPDPDRLSAFRVAACNTFACSVAAETARLSCASGPGLHDCPCAKLAAPVGCVP